MIISKLLLFSADKNETWLDWSIEFEMPELFQTVVKVFKADKGQEENVEQLEKYLKQLTYEQNKKH